MAKSEKTHVAYAVTWTESEAGWGCRPDGASLHLTQDDVQKYIKKYWDGMPDKVPHEYSRPDSSRGKLVKVSSKLHKQIKESKRHGVRLWQHELREMKGNIQE